MIQLALEERITLTNAPTDVLELVLQILVDMEETAEVPYDHERCTSTCLIPLSETCRWLRAQTLPWIFREVYNWNRNGVVVWPNALWGFFVTVNLRDVSVRHPGLLLSPELFSALPMMQAVTKVTLRLDATVPPELMSAFSLISNLSVLEIHQARLDGSFLPVDLPFPSLSSLLICICGFKGVTRVDGIDIDTEKRNIAMLLHILSDRLTSLQISGDLISPEFSTFRWPKLQEFTITEHTPTPFIPVLTLVAHMPALRVFSDGVLAASNFRYLLQPGRGRPHFSAAARVVGILPSFSDARPSSQRLGQTISSRPSCRVITDSFYACLGRCYRWHCNEVSRASISPVGTCDCDVECSSDRLR
ncbi:hypothetical protein B0H12DRAFT_839754 [Mycena haematopus]|nr:hypothetical protein B0H12DRAFT_839754 [Mycena haematopus]